MSNTIKLLDGKNYNKAELLEKMVDDNFYYGELNKLALSSSSLKLMLDSPKTYYYVTKYAKNETTPALRAGHLFHTAILEPEKYEKIKFIDVQSRNTKKFKEAKEHFGSEVFTAKERIENERLVDAMYKNPKAIELLGDCKTEVAAIGTIMGKPFRGKADILKNQGGGIVDLKTTVDVQNFSKSAFRYKYTLQAAIYCELFSTPEKQLTHEDFTFLCIDKANLDIGVWKCSEEFLEYGKLELKRGIERYETYIRPDFDINDYTIQGTL